MTRSQEAEVELLGGGGEGGGGVGVGVEVGAGPGGGGVVGDKLVPQKVVDLTSVKGGHTKCFSKKVSPYQCKFNVARVKQPILVF